MENQLIILGGMGPQASLKLHELLLDMSRVHHDGAPDSYPSILHVSLSVPDFIGSKERYNQALKLLVDSCNNLPLKSASAIGIACNTAHLMEADLPLDGTAFVSMIKAVVNKAKTKGLKKVGLLASPNTIKSNLYANAFKEASIATVTPSRSDLESLDKVIHQVINGEDPLSLRPVLNDIGDRLIKKGADAILLGCTELPLIGLDDRLPAVDSLQALAEAMLDKHYAKA